jgi:hypothetical protein
VRWRQYQHHKTDVDGQETYMFASSCEDVHKGNTASGRSMVLGSGGAKKETIHRVLEAVGVVRGGSSTIVAAR